jgi:hypothetical protein
MMVPYFFWDYNNSQHEFVIRVLKQRARLAENGVFPAEYDGSLNFEKPDQVHGGIPAHITAPAPTPEPEEQTVG